MTSRKRKNSTPNVSLHGVSESNTSDSTAPSSSESRSGSRRKSPSRDLRRRQLLERLEPRQLLAGPQLLGIQPNEGALITDGSVRDSSPRVLTFGFDQDQVIDSSTLEGIRITRAGEDGILGPDANGVVDDIRVTPGLVSLGNPNQNEVVVRFAETLPDDQYRLEVFGFDDIGLGITGLRNTSGELFVSQDSARRSQVTDFQLNLGALVESVVPQPVIRNADGSLTQNRNEIVVYFNEDPLFVEDDDAGNPTERSAENPRFYQLLLTQDTVRTTDDELFNPDQVIYDEATHTARLIFASDINDLPSGAQDGHTWRLRLGTAVDDRADFILAPQTVAVTASAVTDFQHSGLRVTFAEVQVGEAQAGRQVLFEDTGFGGLSVSLNGVGDVVFDFGGDVVDIQGLKDIVASTPAVAAVIDVRNERNNVQNAGANLLVPRSAIGAPALRLEAAGETLTTSLDVGIFGQDNQITSFSVSESIDPQTFALELLGGNDDPGHRDLSNSAGELRRHISPDFGADTTDGITEIAYNFKGIFDTSGGVDFLNQITDVHKQRIREVLGLWAANIGVQFRETLDEGITFAIGDIANLQRVTDTTLVGPTSNIGRSVGNALNASLRIDPLFDQSAIVFSNQTDYELDYGEDFTRKATAGVGFLLGLEQAPDLPPQTIMALDPTFLNQSIDIASENVELEPVFPGNYDIQHGQFIHRTDSVDIDLYRFEVELGDEDKVGQLTLETFAERSADSSLLDTNLSLFQEISAFAVADLGVGSSLGVSFHSMLPGRAGNATEIRFIRTDRAVTDTDVKVNRVVDELGQLIPNAILLDLPRRGPSVATVTAQSVVDAINQDPFASSLLRASVTLGSPTTDISGGVAAPLTVRLGGGGVEKISQNDDYFSEDSRIIATLGEGVYYVGVTASGNDNYDPTIPGSGFGGRTQGAYDLQFKFEPQVDEVDVIRDRDGQRANVPGTPLDGDGDGVQGGVHNFWFETAPANRLLNFTDDGRAVVPGQEVAVLSGTGVLRTYEFVPNGQSGTPGNIPVFYSDGTTSVQTPPGNLAAALAAAINLRSGETGVTVTRVGNGLEFVGERSIELSEDFRAAVAIGRNIFVDKSAGPNADGSLARPFNNIANPDVANAFGSTLPGDIVRIVGNGGLDGDLSTEVDNFSYQIGVSNVGGQSLEDGRALEVPKGVTTIIDAGTILKMRASYASVGSNTLLVDRSDAALQILGTPRLVQLSPEGMPFSTTLIGDTDSGIDGNDDGSVIITSVRDRLADVAAAGTSPAAAPGDWGGLIFRRNVDQFEGRGDLEDVGVFLQRVNHAEIRYGGSSNVLIDSVQQLVNPIQIVNLRPTVTFNEITQSADSAISASPDSFQETSYQSPRFQQAGAFTADYGRVGPDINNNSLLDNSVNGLFIRVPTTATETPRELTVAGRFDDVDIVHVLPENLIISSSPGGSIQDQFAPSLSLVSARQVSGGELAPGDYLYKMTFVDRDGFESLASLDQFAFSLTEDESSVELTALPLVQTATDYVSRRLYRAFDVPDPQFRLVGELDASSNTFIDGTGIDPNDPGLVTLDLAREGIRGRLDASLVLDPGVVVKMSGTRIELQPGSVLLAEGDASNPIALTGIRDDRFGAGGTFDTNNDADAPIVVSPSAGDWAGVYAGPTSSVNFDNVIVSYAGGISLIEGGETLGFVPLQLQQAEGRITNSRFEFNDSGQDGAGPTGRFGRLSATPSTIFVRGSQPIIVGNTFSDNDGSIIDIDSDSLTADRQPDSGRQTGALDRFDELDDNFGPLIRFNRYEDNNLPGLDQITGLEIRGGTLATESVWDDTDIVHLLFDSITVDNLHSGGGLKLRSRPDESLVVKLGDQGTQAIDTTARNRVESTSGQGTPNSATIGTGLTASGTPNDAVGRLGGSISILGLPDSPVVLTSYRDDSVGAGLTPEGTQFTDNNGDGTNSRPEPNDWRSILLDQYSSDRNVDVIPELELSTAQAPGLNGSVANAQVLGQLAGSLTASDEVLRLGFEVEGFLSAPNDVDTYSFIGRPGTEVWVDIDDTSFTLDTVIELLDADGNVLARSDNSGEEVGNGSQVDILDSRLEGLTTSLQARDPQYSEFGAGGVYEDFGTVNPRDAGIHFTLTGNSADPNSSSTYFFRVRSASTNPDDVAGGLTNGGYRFQVRLTEDQEFPGSVVRYSDIRYANHGIHVQGLLGTSPLLGEASENEARVGFTASNDNIDAPGLVDVPSILLDDDTTNPSQRAQYLGNLTGNRNNVISVAGELGNGDVVDFYQIDIFNDDVNDALRSTIFDIDYADGFNRPNTNISVFYDPDGEFDDTFTPRLILHGTDSNILDDLTSPNGENSAEEKLSRGSIKTGDPLVGPVTLEEGTYYVAITNGNQLPTELDETQNPFVRREPINSVRRIAEQRFDPDEGPSTASGPVLPELFSDAAIASSGFALTADQLPGHGKNAHYDGSFGVFSQSSAVLNEQFVFGDAADFVGGAVRGSSLDTLDWSLDENGNIGTDNFGFFFTNQSVNTSRTIPHVTIDGNLAGEQVDFYEFTVDPQLSTFATTIIDIDFGFDPNDGIDPIDGLLDNVPVDPGSINTRLYLFRESDTTPGTYTQVASDTFDFFLDNRDGRLGSSANEDAFIQRELFAGTYVIGVAQDTVTLDIDAGSITIDGDPLAATETTATYQLHVSVDEHPLSATPLGDNNDILSFDRATRSTPGTLSSNAFDLTGYVAADLPTAYFNYRLLPESGDLVEFRVVSAENPTGQVIANADTDNGTVDELTGDGVWRQLRADLGNFAGDTDVRIDITYTPSAVTPSSADLGLSLDDMIVGFAERGESVFNTQGGNTTFFDAFSGTAAEVPNLVGEYQLETRTGTTYAVPSSFRTELQFDFDTNDRHSQSLTIVAPAGNQLADGDTFVIGDGGFNQTFEFTTTPGTIQFGNTPVLFNPSDSPAEIAQAIRTAIALQTNIDIEASSAAGQDNEPLTDGRLSLSGSARGSFFAVNSVDDGYDPASGDPPPALSRDAAGNVLLLAILHDGIGDENFLRTQGQVIVDSNKISDVRAIGIWSEPGLRDFDPEDIRPFERDFGGFFGGGLGLSALEIDGNHPFLQLPRTGNAYPGYARNLPTLNDSVDGGLAPGIVVVNNTIDSAGFAGVKVDGETAPIVIDAFDLTAGELLFNNALTGDMLEGTLLTIDAGGTRVIFEFEEINGAPTAGRLGSATESGNGVRDGHIPIYYRETNGAGSSYNFNPPAVRDAYSSIELATSIMQSIQGSPLVTNGLVELVTPTIGPSPTRRSFNAEALQQSAMDYPTAAVYLEGASNVYITPQSGVNLSLAPVAESVQPFARIVNNTIYGTDGREALFPQSNDEPNDLISAAIDTKVGPNNREVYTSTANLGDNQGPVGPAGDVDFYRVSLDLGDRLVVDIDTVDGGANTAIQIFDERGERQLFDNGINAASLVALAGATPDYLDPASDAQNLAVDADNTRDAFADFFAPAKGVYYVGISGDSNVNYDPNTLSGRPTNSNDELGAYTINMNTFAPRTHVISADSGSATGIRASDLAGATITVTQVADLPANQVVNGRPNQVTFTFGAGGATGINLNDEARLPDIMQAISNAIDPLNQQTLLPNNESSAALGPIARVRAAALGGIEGENEGIANLGRRGLRNGVLMTHRDGTLVPINGLWASDFLNTLVVEGGDVGFGHDVRNASNGTGTTENYVFVENAAKIELNDIAINAGLNLDPVSGFATDQLINETGVSINSGASPAVLNNLFINLHESLVVAETFRPGAGFGSNGADQQIKPMEVVAVANIFQYDEPTATLFNRGSGTNTGITTGPNEPSNINGGTDDFNLTVAETTDVLVHPAGDNFVPAPFSPAIDSNVDSLLERSEFAALKQSVGIPISNVLAPRRDVTGINRADNPNFSNTGQGSAVFGDRGSTELADFVGPTAIAEVPRDNDAEGLDGDPNVSFIALSEGVFEEFRIQLQDAGDASDPFTGSGIDNNTVVVPAIPGLRASGANVTVFEDDRLLTEGIDYTFNYDETKSIITLTPLAGIWFDDRAYRIQLNNTDRTVVRAPRSSDVRDGDQIEITDSNGGRVVFEIESGFVLQMPEPITLDLPIIGTNQGGLSDGGVFTINDGTSSPVVFEFDTDGTTLPSSVSIPLPAGGTPVDPNGLSDFLQTIAQSIQTSIQNTTSLDVDVAIEVDDDPAISNDVEVRNVRLIIGAERGARVDVATSGLVPATRSLGFQIPAAGADVGGVEVGDTFTINDGELEQLFEFVDGTNPPAVGIGVSIAPIAGTPMTATQVAAAIQQAVLLSALQVTPDIVGQHLHLDLPANGSASSLNAGAMRLVSLSRTPVDGDLITFSPNDGGTPVVFEINRTDMRDENGNIINDDVPTQTHIGIDITRLTTGDQLAEGLANAIQPITISGLNDNQVRPAGNGVLSLGGQPGLGLSITPGSSLEVVGSPDVTGPSTLQVFGPLVLRVPDFGIPTDGDTIELIDDAGATVILEFDSVNSGVLTTPGALPITFTGTETQDVLANLIAMAIDDSNSGIGAENQGGGEIRLGQIAESRVDATNSFLSTRRGIVVDGEILTIIQAGSTVNYEFESVNNGGGVTGNNIPVPFQPGSTPLDVSNSLAAAINNNSGGLRLSAEVRDGLVALQDLPGTVVDVTQAPGLILTGVPGGAVPVNVSPGSTREDVKQALLNAINSVNNGPEGVVTTLSAQDRGGDTLFVENGLIFEGPITSFVLPAIRDLQGNPLEANRADNTTQFTILMPTVGLDFGDAPDPVGNIPGRYPTELVNDGARHVVTDDLYLGTQIDVDAGAQPSRDSDGDDAVTDVTETGSLFSVTFNNGEAQVNVNVVPADPLIHEGNTITINTGVTTATLEFDTDNRFDEDHFPIQPTDLNSVDSILQAIEAAIIESPVEPAGLSFVSTSIVINGDDEDGINFISSRNPGGVFNRNVVTPIEVTVTGSGILQGWIDYDADGDWSADEQVVFYATGADPSISAGRTQVPLSGEGTRTFTFDTFFPQSSPDPLSTTETAARFRISKTGDLLPTGLSLNGEVEDYQVLLVAGNPPTIAENQRVRSFSVNEDGILQALDSDGNITGAIPGDDGLLARIIDPDGDNIQIVPEDAVVRTLTTENGTVAGELDLETDGTFTFRPAAEFNGVVQFTARVTDIKTNAAEQLVAPEPVVVSLNVVPVNDAPTTSFATIEFNEQTDEDQSVIFTAEDLIDPFYSPGPQNESDQLLVFQSVSSTNLGDSVSSRGGILEILAGGRSVRYTPPVDFNGSETDVFNFVVADVPGASQIVQSAAKPGTVSITVAAVNDAPITGDDFYNATEDTALSIAVRGSGSIVGILDNDVAGPLNETQAPESQTIDLVAGQFPVQTLRGGVVRFEAGQLVYSPPGLYSGPDGFTYQVVDNLGAESTGSVSIVVGGENDAPRFEGVDGVTENGLPVTQISLPESKPDAQSSQYDLNTWFSDPENDALTYSVASSNTSIVEVNLDGSTLTLTRPAFAFGTVNLTVIATDTMGLSTSQNVSVSIINENDSPLLIGALDPQSTNEDQVLVQELSGIFSDPDGDNLSYTVTRLGGLIRPSASQIADHPLLDSITFVGDEMRITPAANQSGSVFIEIEASDGSFRTSDAFTLTINPLPDAPIAGEDGYNVAVGSTLRVLNPAEGLLRNDSDADGETILVDLTSVTAPQFGTLEINSNGTFVYVNTTGTVGERDSFQYRAIDSTGRVSDLQSVSLNLGQSQYQNPIPNMQSDVTADGFITPIDALRVINLLGRLGGGQGSLAVSAIGTPPPDFVDVNGDGEVTPLDALTVINTLAQRQADGSEGEGVSLGLASARTTSFASLSSDFLPISNLTIPAAQENSEPTLTLEQSTDVLLAGGLQIESGKAESAVDELVNTIPVEDPDEFSVDDVLSDWGGMMDSIDEI